MRRLYISALFALFSFAAGAQNINQSVQVTNDYESRLSDLKKLGLEISVPDSLLRFDYKFDYTVFDTEYKGAYEFSPYLVQVKPDKSVYDGRKGLLRVGAGYFVHPELDFVFSPVQKKSFSMSIYADADGYLQAGDDYNFGMGAGTAARWIGKHAVSELGVEYRGVLNSAFGSSDSYHSAGVDFGVHSAREGSYFFYDVRLGYRYGMLFGQIPANVQLLDFKASAGPVIKNRYRILVDLEAKPELSNTTHSGGNGIYLAAKPHLRLAPGSVVLDAGVKIDYTGKLAIAPVAEAGVKLFKGSQYLYAAFSGGQTLHSFHELKTSNYRFNNGWYGPSANLVSREIMNAYAGMNGNLGSHVQYRLKAGFGVWDTLSEQIGQNGTMYVLQNLNAVHGGLDMSFRYEKMNLLLDATITKNTNQLTSGYAPSLLKGKMSFDYTWAKRVTLGLGAEGATRRVACYSDAPGDIPGYVDVNLLFQYGLTRSFALWAKGGNLACMQIQRVAGYVEKGPYGTVGINLIF